MIQRVLSAIVLIPLVTAAVFLAPPLVFSLVIALLGAINFYELLQMARPSWPAPPPWLPLAGSAVAGFVVSHPVCPEFRTLGVVLFFLFQACLSVLYSEKVEEVFGRVVLPVAGFVYIYVFFSFVYEIRFALVPGRGAWLLIAFLAMQWVGDTFAFLAGSAFGRHKLRPLLSPKKSVEGTVGGLVGSAAVGAILALAVFPEQPWWPFAVLGLFMGAFGQLGDLLESQFKRAFGVKDSSRLIPGHGGLLDRMDSLLLTAPLFYLGLRWFL